jgi:hypothetical protein
MRGKYHIECLGVDDKDDRIIGHITLHFKKECV